MRAADRQVFDAEIIAADPRSDLAVIVPVAVPGMPAPKLKPLPLGDASLLRKGAFLIALGNPVQRRPGRQALGKLGNPLERRPQGRARAG